MVNKMQHTQAKPNATHHAGASRTRYSLIVLLLAALAFQTLFLLASDPARASDPAVVSSLDLSLDGKAQILSISLSRQPETVHSFALGNPDRLVMDITPARLPGGKRDLPADHPLIHGVRAAQFARQTVRVVLDLKQDATHLIASRPAAADQAEHQVLVNLSAVGPASTGYSARPGQGPDAPALLTAKQSDQAGPDQAAARDLALRQDDPARRIILFDNDPTDRPARDQETASPLGRLEISGFFMAKAAQELRESGGAGQPRMLRNTIRAEGKWTPPHAADDSWALSGETMFVLASLQSEYLWFGPNPSTDGYDLELYEGYLFRAAPGWDLRLGRQTVRWGKADQISPVDNVNPQDFREFILPDLEDRKVPNWMARVRLFPGALTLEGVFVPFFEPDRFDYSGTKWALFGIEQPGLEIRETTPAKNLNNADWGMRSAATAAGWDVAVSYVYAWEKGPRLELLPGAPHGPVLQAGHHRQHIVGLEFETTLDKFGFRGEGAYFHRQSLHAETLDSAAKPVAHYVLGVDYLGEQDWYANVQFSHQHVVDHEPGILHLRRDDYFLNGEINREFWRGNVMLKLGYALDLRDGGFFLTPESILTYFKNLELSLGANVFAGSEDTLFGRYRNNDQVFLKAKYFF